MFLFSFALMAVAYRSPLLLIFHCFYLRCLLRYEYVYYTVGDGDESKGEKNEGFEAEESDEKGREEEEREED